MVCKRTVAKAIGLALLPGSLLGQTVHGTVTDRASNAPLAGAIVQLVDSSGRAVSRALTSERGEFWVSAPMAGSYRVRTLRIGFKPQNSDAVRLGAGEMAEMPLAIASLPVSLDTIKVAGKSACMARGDTALATYAAWEQVRAALTAAQLTTRSSDLTATLMTYERALDPTFPRVRRQSTAFTSAISGRPWRSTTPDSLRRYGYVVPDLLGGKLFLAPDLDVLLSSAFLEDHCLRLARGSDAKQLGIDFEPTKDRSAVADISGTVWMDRASAELREMQFRYEHLETAESDANPGGEMQFLRLAGGAWAISKWMIRMPVMEEFNEKVDHRSTTTQKVVRIIERRITGGELVAVMRGDDTLWSRPPMVASGTVVDSVSHDEIAGARLAVLGTPFTATTDKKGAFSIAGLLPGEYTLEVVTPALDSVGGRHSTPFSFTDASARTRIVVPPADNFAVLYCGERIERPVASGMALGTVRMAGDTTPPWNVWVIAEWNDKGQRSADARTDAYGRYRICGVPLKTSFTIRTELDDTSTAPRTAEIPKARRFLHRDLEIARPVMAAGTYFTGGVMTQWTREPIADAEVTLPDLGLSARTNERGRFRLGGIPAGNQRILIRKLGYSAFESTVRFAADAPTSRQFQLFKTATLDTVNVVADRRMQDFEENRRLGLGHFLTRAELAKMENVRFQDVLRQIPGLNVANGFGNHAWLVKGWRGVKPEHGCIPIDPVVDGWKGAKPCQCYASVYLDGMLVYSPKPPAGGFVKGADGKQMRDGNGNFVYDGIPQPLFDLNEVAVSQIEAVEYYASEVQMPMRYMGSCSNCGVIVIHTRQDFKKP